MTKTTSKKYYAWVGQNATCGTPHPTTGRMSMYGDNYVFDNKAERDEYVDNYIDNNPSVFAVKCSYRELRGYNLGCSVYDFEQDLTCRNVSKIEDENGNIFWDIY